ncbi:TY1B-NL2 [Symbiodinium microadriaticum]|nr:TY1B-NL2 [Symbiodinium microadriaticum]
MYVHGGVAGLRGNTERMKWCTKCLVEAGKKFCERHEFSAVGLFENVNMGCHRDSHNDASSENAVVMLKNPDAGGGFWLESEAPHPQDPVWNQVKGEQRGGELHDLELGRPFFFNPRRWHEVKPWEGDRVAMVLYSPRASHLHYRDKDRMEFVGFPVNLSDAINTDVTHGKEQPFLESSRAELHLLQPLPNEDQGSLEEVLLAQNEDQEQLIEDLEERSTRLRLLLEEEEALAEECRRAGRQAADEVENVRGILEDMIADIGQRKAVLHEEQQQRCLRIAQVTQDNIDYEHMLETMQGDLEVVHTVPLEQVRDALPKWMGAVEKEVKQLLDGTLKPMEASTARDLERQGKLKLVPSKAVCTLKPPATKGEKARRKFRLVLCGNFAARDDPAYDLYAGGASAETVRLALTVAAGKRWSGATSDITAAFLLATWPSELARYAIYPPRMLVDAGFIGPGQVWEVLRTVVLRQSQADPDLWLVFDERDKVCSEDTLLGLVVTYVDDLLYLADPSLITAIHTWIELEWPCSSLEWATEPAGTRYLGMEIHQRADFNFEISQGGYIKELLRNHNMDEVQGSRLPCPKEWLCEGEGEEDQDENYSSEELKFAQRVVGEQLWLTMRTRPDLQFPVGFMAARVSRLPNRVAQVARKILAYLKSTQEMKLVMGPNGNESVGALALVGYSDASFSPFGEKSFGAELYETANALVLIESVGSILDEIVGTKVPRLLRVDNSSALAMIQGGPGSWRTRHLKVRSAKIRDEVESGGLQVEHITGDLQLADLATKMHPKMRLWELLTLWGFKDLPYEAVEALEAKSAYLALLVMALIVTPADAEEEPSESRRLQSIGVDELMLVTVLVCIAAVSLWEVLKWATRGVIRFFRETPKQRKLRRLKETARLAAEEEVDRVLNTSPEAEVGPPEPHPVPRARPQRRIVDPEPERSQPDQNFELMPSKAYYKTNSTRSKLHTNPQCHGLRNSGDVYAVEYCAYCQRDTPLYTRRSRSLQPTRSY